MKIFRLISKNLTHLGGPMGSEYTYNNFTKSFATLESAKSFAEDDYKGEETIKWSHPNDTVWRSQDLGYVMYNIKKEEVL